MIDVGGVGYLVLVSGRTLDALGPVGGEVMLLTEIQVREDGWTLFGFGSAGERETFRALTSVQGVGGTCRAGHPVGARPAELARAVSRGDKAMVAAPTASAPSSPQRIVNELRASSAPGAGRHRRSANRRGGAAADALLALANLGFKPAEASAAVAAASDELGPKRPSTRWCGWR